MSAIPSKVREQVERRSHGLCEAQITTADHRCKGIATVVHHKQRRAVGGHDLENLLHLCDPCHRYCHANPAWARENGFIVSAFAPSP